MSTGHRLLSARRTIAPERLAAYGRAWARVRAAAAAAGAHAWRFHAAAAPDSYLEFLEWSAAAGDLTAEPGLARALAELGAAFPGTVERWDEVPPPDLPEEEPT